MLPLDTCWIGFAKTWLAMSSALDPARTANRPRVSLKQHSSQKGGSRHDSRSRCGSRIIRAVPHVTYAVTTIRLTDAPDTYLGEVLHDDEIAILCSTCEDPGLLVAAPVVAEIERTA